MGGFEIFSKLTHCLPSGRTLFWSDLLVARRVVSWERWERWEGGEAARWKRWVSSKVASLVRLEGSEVANWERWEVVRWQGGEGERVVKW